MFHWIFSSHKERTSSWYIIFIIVVLTLVVFGIIQKIYLMSVVSILFAGVYIFIENNADAQTEAEVTDAGIRVGTSFYEYDKIKNFSIITVSGVALYLRILLKKGIGASMDIPLTQDVNHVELKNYLAERLELDENSELTTSDRIIHGLRI